MKAEYLLKVLVLWIVIFFPLRAHSAGLGELRLNQIEGDVQVQSAGMKEWLPAVMNLPLQIGDRLWVPQGAWAQVETREGSVIRHDAESAVEMVAADKDSLQLYLSQGQAYINFQGGRDRVLQIDTPVSSIRAYDSSTFNVKLNRDGNGDVSVFRGAVFAESRSGEVRVTAGKMLSQDDGTPFLMELGPPSDWEEWNRKWDESLAGDDEDSEQYLPPELTVYGRDLNRNGRWVTTSDYGYVWTPTTHISTNWAPYRTGRWVWIGDDYVWIGSEPWGWAPYHYGRWSHIPSHGWCWIPPRRNEVYWGPGYVSWVATSTSVAWVPLAPAEIYYGRGHYGPHSVNIVNVQVNNYIVVQGRNYRNSHVQGAVTVVQRDAFLGGRYYDEHNDRDRGRHNMVQQENPFLRENISIGRPRIDPQHTTKMPILKDIPKEHEPPAHIRSVPGVSRDMIRERDRSVFTPTAKPQPLTPTVRMNTEREVKQEGGRTLPGAGGRQEILEHSVKPGQFRGRPTINRDNGQEVEPFSDGKKEIRKPIVPPIPVQEQPALENKEGAAPSFRGRPRLPMVRPGQSQDRPTLDQDALKSAPPAIERPEVVRPPAPEQPDANDNDNDKTPPSFRGRPQMPDRTGMPGQFRGRPAIEQDAPKPPPSQPAIVRPQMAPPPAPVHEQPDVNDKPAPSFRGRPQMPDRTEMPGQFRGRPAIEQDAPKPPPNQPAVERRQVAPPPAPAPQQGHPGQPDPEAVKRLQQQAAEKEKKKQEEADRMREMLEQGKQQKGKRPTFP